MLSGCLASPSFSLDSVWVMLLAQVRLSFLRTICSFWFCSAFFFWNHMSRWLLGACYSAKSSVNAAESNALLRKLFGAFPIYSDIEMEHGVHKYLWEEVSWKCNPWKFFRIGCWFQWLIKRSIKSAAKYRIYKQLCKFAFFWKKAL